MSERIFDIVDKPLFSANAHYSKVISEVREFRYMIHNGSVKILLVVDISATKFTSSMVF